MKYNDPLETTSNEVQYMGLGPCLRASIAGEDLRLAANQMLDKLVDEPTNSNLLMNLSIMLQCLDQHDIGMDFQREALANKIIYRLPASQQPARLSLLILVAPGDIQSNTPLECLLENSDIDLIFYYVLADDCLLTSMPDHDILFVGISDSDEHRELLRALQNSLENWQKPVLNSPQYLPFTARDIASTVLREIPRLIVPPTVRLSVATVLALAHEQVRVASIIGGGDFPIILRPVGSQAGEFLERITCAADISNYLTRVNAQEFFIAPFIDYSDLNGDFKKIRIVLINGESYVCHMAVSSNWMVHYVNAGMYEDAWKRNEEAGFMNDFGSFVLKHKPALDEIAKRMHMEYLVIDCAETKNGDLLLFEIDHIGVVHSMDLESIFPYKKKHMHKVQSALSNFLYSLVPSIPVEVL